MKDKYRWHEQYDQGVPPSLKPYPAQTLLDKLEEGAQERPGHPALLFMGARISWSKLKRQVESFAAALNALGVQKGDRVATLLPNCPQAVICQLGAWKVGAILMPLNPQYTPNELLHTLQDVTPRVAVVLTPFYEKLKQIQPETSLEHVIACKIKTYLPLQKRILFTLLRERKDGHKIQLQAGDSWFSAQIRRHLGAQPPAVHVDPTDPAMLMLTGGTMGPPKAALSSHQALLMSGMQLEAWLGTLSEPWDDVMMLLMPLFHTYGNVGAFSVAMVNHMKMVLVPNPRDLDDLLDTINRERPSYVGGVPTLYSALLNHARVRQGEVDLGSIKLCISGAAPLMEETRHRFENLTGGHMVEGYALTESVMAAVLSPVKGDTPPGAIGLPLPDVEIRIVDRVDGQRELAPGEIGEIWIRAPQLMLGYWNRPDDKDEMLQDGWLRTGDVGYLDEKGFMYMVDRGKDVIKPSGFQVWPREVEEVIATHPAVQEICVGGVPDERQGEAVKAWIVLKEGASLTKGELRAHCKQELAAYKVPRQLEFRDELPKSTVGKILRRALVEEHLAAQKTEATVGESIEVLS